MTFDEALGQLIIEVISGAPVTLALLWLIWSAQNRDNTNTQLLTELLRECIARKSIEIVQVDPDPPEK